MLYLRKLKEFEIYSLIFQFVFKSYCIALLTQKLKSFKLPNVFSYLFILFFLFINIKKKKIKYNAASFKIKGFFKFKAKIV